MKHLFSLNPKQISRFTALFLIVVFVALTGVQGWGQTITVTSLSPTSICESSGFTVNFSWASMSNKKETKTFYAQYENPANTWNNVGSFSISGNGNSSGTASITGAGPSIDGSFNVRVIRTAPTPEVISSNFLSLTVNALPTAVLSGDATICAGTSTYLIVELTGTPPWSIIYTDGTTPRTVNSIIASPAAISVSPTSNTTYRLNSVSNSNCTGTSYTGTATVTVKSVPTPTFTQGPGLNTCANTEVTYATEPDQTDYLWTFPGSAIGVDYSISSGGSITDNAVTLKWLTPGSKTVGVNYTNSYSCAASDATLSTTNIELSVPTFIEEPDPNICANTDVTYSTQTSQTDYVWAFPGSTSDVDYSITSGGTSADNTVTLKWLTQGDKEVRVSYTNTSGCEITPASTTTTVNNTVPDDAGPISGASTVISGSTGVTYSVAPITNASSYIWTYLGTGVTINGSGNSISIDFTSDATSGNLTVQGSNGCVGLASSFFITVNILPIPEVFNLIGTGSYCSTGNGLQITLDGSETGVDYQMYKNNVPEGSPVPGTGSPLDFGIHPAGTYTVEGTNSYEITTVMSGNAVITVADPPTAYAGPQDFAVKNVPYLLSGSTATNYSSLVWSIVTGTGVFNDPTILHPTYTQGSPNGAVVTLQLTATSQICPAAPATSTVQLIIIPQPDSKTWTGGIDNTWGTPGNWNPNDGFAPLQTTNVTIPVVSTNYPAIKSNAVCNNLTINSGAVLTINAGNSLSVSATLTNSAGVNGLILQSNATGTGSLLNNTTGVNATVQRYIAGNWDTYLTGWHFISSPVSGQAISAFATGNYDFYGWDEVSNLWMNYKDPGFSSWNGGANFNTGQGYMISYEANQTNSFTGTLNAGNVGPFSNLSLSGGANYSWHLLGNPFSSAVTWNIGSWAKSNVAGTAKIWNESGQSYSDIGSGGIIPSAQGFMVSVNSATNSITIPADSRTNSNTAWYKSSETQHLILIASQQDGSSYQESKILINPEATTGFDFEYDSRFLAGYAPQFYSISADEMLSTNSLPAIDGSEIIPFGFVKNYSDNFKIELKEAIQNIAVYLKDKKNGTVTDLNKTPVYSFTSEASDDPARFELSFLDVTGVTKPDSKDNFTVYQSKGNINITSPANVNADILVTNLVGQVVMRGKTNGNALTTLNAGNLQNGVYVVSLVGNGKKVSKKLVVSK